MEGPKRLNFMQSHKELQIATERRTPELHYAYYRRCWQFRKNGEQCKAPALKGEQICHQHAGQAATEYRRKQQRRELLSKPGLGFGDFSAIQRTIAEVAHALIEDRIDCKTAGRLAVELQSASAILWRMQKIRKEFTTEARRQGERQIPTPVILSGAPQKSVRHKADRREVEGPQRCFVPPYGIKAFSRELPNASLGMQKVSGSFDSPLSRVAGLGLAQDDRRK